MALASGSHSTPLLLGRCVDLFGKLLGFVIGESTADLSFPAADGRHDVRRGVESSVDDDGEALPLRVTSHFSELHGASVIELEHDREATILLLRGKGGLYRGV